MELDLILLFVFLTRLHDVFVDSADGMMFGAILPYPRCNDGLYCTFELKR